MTSAFRWVVYSHEMLHSFSIGFEDTQYYEKRRGWEEGVVESLERLVRPKLVNDLQVQFDRNAQAETNAYEDTNDYNRYIRALEALRRILGYEDTPAAKKQFYVALLGVHIRHRLKWALKSAMEITQASHPVIRERILNEILAINDALCRG